MGEFYRSRRGNLGGAMRCLPIGNDELASGLKGLCRRPAVGPPACARRTVSIEYAPPLFAESRAAGSPDPGAQR